MAFREFHYRWVFDLKSTPEALWPFIADTNRFNRDTGVPSIDVDWEKETLRNARRNVRLSLYGMNVAWEEQPFEWVRPVRFGVERIYSKGPVARMRVLAQLEPGSNGGTRLIYEVQATPGNLIGFLAIPVQLKFLTEPRVRAAFHKYDELAFTRADVVSSKASSSAPDYNRSRMESSAAKLRDSDPPDDVLFVVERLTEFISNADDLAVARMRPYQLADSWNMPRRSVLETFLRATRAGLLDLRWALLCPMCRGAKETGNSLRNIPAHAHCSTCKIDFESNFDRFVELTFTPNPAIRRVAHQDYCVGSPEYTPHIVVQQLLQPEVERSIKVPLGAGDYRLRVLDLPGSQLIKVTTAGNDTAVVDLSPEGFSKDVVSVGPLCTFTVRNQSDAEQLLILERTAWSDQAVTAAEVTALQMFRDLFSSEALRPGEQISVGTLTVLFTDLRHSTQLYREIGDATAFGRVMNHFDVLKRIIAAHDGAIVKTIGDAVMAVFRCPAKALEAMLLAQEELSNPNTGGMPLQLKAGLHSGPCIAVTLNDRLDYFGSTVNMASRLEGLSDGTDVIISRAVFEDTKVIELLQSSDYEVRSFKFALKGFEDEQTALWRVSKRKTS